MHAGRCALHNATLNCYAVKQNYFYGLLFGLMNGSTSFFFLGGGTVYLGAAPPVDGFDGMFPDWASSFSAVGDSLELAKLSTVLFEVLAGALAARPLGLERHELLLKGPEAGIFCACMPFG